MNRKKIKLTRRTALKGIGVSIGLPLLEAMVSAPAHAQSSFRPLAKSEVTPKPRMIFCYVPNGVNIMEWVPRDAGRAYTLSPTLQTLGAYRDDFTVISGIGHPHSRGGHSGADTWLTGADLAGTPGSVYTNSISVDQVVAEAVGHETRIPSLQLSDGSGTGIAGHSLTLSFNRNGTPLPAENRPLRLFTRLFVQDSAASREETLRRYAEKRSILDAVMTETRSLESQLGQADREKLGEFVNSVRETELRVNRLENWIDVPRPSVDANELLLNSQPWNAHDRTMWLDVMLEISYLAFATDTTRVITFEWSREAAGFGGNGEDHHELSHHGGDADMLERLARVDRFHLERLGRFTGLLKSTPEGERNMLDHTMIMYGSGMNSGRGGEHSPQNLPLLVAGGNARGLKHGNHLAFDTDDHPPLSNLLVNLMHGMGLEQTKFQDSTGPISGLA